jgi:hypothetical protein
VAQQFIKALASESSLTTASYTDIKEMQARAKSQ